MLRAPSAHLRVLSLYCAVLMLILISHARNGIRQISIVEICRMYSQHIIHPRSVAVNHAGLWIRRHQFESGRGYQDTELESHQTSFRQTVSPLSCPPQQLYCPVFSQSNPSIRTKRSGPVSQQNEGRRSAKNRRKYILLKL